CPHAAAAAPSVAAGRADGVAGRGHGRPCAAHAATPWQGVRLADGYTSLSRSRARGPRAADRERHYRRRLAQGYAGLHTRDQRITGRRHPCAARPRRIRPFFGECSMELDIVALSRLQFAMTALYHFIFVPLTIGLSVLIAIMETVYVMTDRA